MNDVLAALCRRNDGVVTRRQTVQMVPRWVLDDAVRAGRLSRVLPGVYVTTALVDPGRGGASPIQLLGPRTRRRAVLAYADDRAVLSHCTALEIWGLREQPGDEPLHLTVPSGVGIRGRPGLTSTAEKSLLSVRLRWYCAVESRWYGWSGHWWNPGRCCRPLTDRPR
jgi:hypothetical protein